MNIRSLQTFIRVVELKSFTKAACELNYVQSTVTMQIQQLEKELGYPLFDRIGKKIALTSYGENFFIYANEVLQIMQRVNNVGKNPEEMKGTLRIGLLESLLSGTTQHIFPLFKAHYKNIEVHLKMGQLYELLPLLRQGQLDMLYISGELNMDPDFHCCYKRKSGLYLSPGSSAGRRTWRISRKCAELSFYCNRTFRDLLWKIKPAGLFS